MTLSSDLGADYAHYNKPLLKFLNDQGGPLDYITIMNYFDDRNNAHGKPAFFHGMLEENTMVGGLEQNLALWSAVPLLIGVETGPTSIAPDWQSFYQEGWRPMYAMLDHMMAHYSGAGLLGWAVHHYAPHSFAALCEWGGEQC